MGDIYELIWIPPPSILKYVYTLFAQSLYVHKSNRLFKRHY
jgi:hypothetical protein